MVAAAIGVAHAVAAPIAAGATLGVRIAAKRSGCPSGRAMAARAEPRKIGG